MKLATTVAVTALALASATQAQAPVAPAAAPAAAPRPPAPVLPQIVIRKDPALDALISVDAKVELLATDFGATEGPIWLGDRLMVSDQRKGEWVTISMTGQKTVIQTENGGPINPEYKFFQGANGAAPYKDGSIIAARQANRDIEVYKAGKFKVLADHYQGKRFNAPNDMAVAKDDSVWFTDPSFSLPGGVGGPFQEIPFMGVYRIAPDGKVTLIDSELKLPNGIVFSLDEKLIYINDYSIGKIYVYDVAKNGTVSNKREFASFDRGTPEQGFRGNTDGMKLDEKGNLWSTVPGGVAILTPQGKELGRIQINGPATNVEFGGPDGKTLFITGGANVWKVPVKVRGAYGH